MTRIHHGRPQHAAPRSNLLERSRAVVKKPKPYKVVLEVVTQEKKKLHSILTYASDAPNGFGFVPAGNPEFTEWCKEQCRQRNLDVHIVSAKPRNKMHTDPEKLSHHVHRVGHHFPIEIVNLACSKFGYVYDEQRGLRKLTSAPNWIARGFEDYSSRQVLHGRPKTKSENKEDTRGAIREMFPKIPETDLNSIVNHAFEEGTKRVGNATELSLARRVQLAVVAHIRHVYTDYDKLLKTGSWLEARHDVEHISLAKLKEWRDESGEKSNETEEAFREVIVIDDDENSGDEDSVSTPDEREQSMEIVSNRATARDLQPERHPEYLRMDVHSTRRLPRRTIMVHPYPPPRQHPLAVETRPTVRNDIYSMAHSRPMPMNQPSRTPALRVVPRAPQPLMQEIDGRMYHVSVTMVEPRKHDIKVYPPIPSFGTDPFQLEPIRNSYGPTRPENQPEHLARVTPRYTHEYVQPPPPPPSSFNRAPAPPRRASEQDVVLPSVERETIDLTSSPRHIAHGHASHHDPRPITSGYAADQPQKRKSFPAFQDDREIRVGQDPKRLRPVYQEDRPVLPTGPSHTSYPAHPGSYQPMESHRRLMAPPAQEYIDLTQSPRRAPYNGDNGYHMTARPRAAPASLIHMTSRRSPPRDVGGSKFEVHAVEPHRGYVPYSGQPDGRTPAGRDYNPVRADQHRPPVDGLSPRYLRNDLH